MGVISITFKRSVDGCSGVDDALVKYGDLSRRIVNRIITSLGERHASSRNNDRALGYIVSSQRNDIGQRSAELSAYLVFVFLGNLLSDCLCRIIQLRIAVTPGNIRRYAFGRQRLIHVIAERLNLREKHTAVTYGITVNIVEIAVAVRLVVIVKTVGAQQPDDRLVLNLLLRDIRKVNTCRVALILHVKAELIFLNRRSKVINVLHHQVPVALTGIIARIL